MRASGPFSYTKNVWRVPFLMVLTMWLVYWSEIKFGWNFTRYGILPRTFSGLRGIALAPFIHSSAGHLTNNTIPLFLFVSFLIYFYKALATQVLFYGGISTGLLTWLIGVQAYHIGMSGIVYLLFSFLFFSGVFRRYYRLISVSLIVIFLYGGLLWYVFPIEKGISWEGHLSGLLVGFVLSYLYRSLGPQKQVYPFTKDAFDALFDAAGNFNPSLGSEEKSDAE
jgi:membrane associated rhomboid family serine protease